MSSWRACHTRSGGRSRTSSAPEGSRVGPSPSMAYPSTPTSLGLLQTVLPSPGCPADRMNVLFSLKACVLVSRAGSCGMRASTPQCLRSRRLSAAFSHRLPRLRMI
jgi:hypothetical protein